jgi:hypothetical protein
MSQEWEDVWWPVPGSSEHVNKPASAIKGGEVLESRAC